MVKTKIIGILNITPDSFSDDGLYYNEDIAIQKMQQLIEDGVDIIDVGAESTRPGATVISLEEEFERLRNILPKIIKIAHEKKVLVSVDTYKTEIIKFALKNNADIINDQTGLDSDEKIKLLAHYQKPVIIMHSLTIPTDRSINIPENLDVIEELKTWINNKINCLEKCGIKKDKIIFDPGLGFGKTFDQCFEIIKHVEELKSLPVKLCVGHSKKGFIRSIGDVASVTLAVSVFLAAKGVNYIRVHDTNLHGRLLRKLQ